MVLVALVDHPGMVLVEEELLLDLEQEIQEQDLVMLLILILILMVRQILAAVAADQVVRDLLQEGVDLVSLLFHTQHKELCHT
tara:strand:- start:14 stop:262 length:249 start_codon:yes stop_codon:yes gene_type:complete